MGDENSKAKAGRGGNTVSQVNGGWIKRDERSGRFVEVGSAQGVSRAKPGSQAAIEKASEDRHDALKRLANR